MSTDREVLQQIKVLVDAQLGIGGPDPFDPGHVDPDPVDPTPKPPAEPPAAGTMTSRDYFIFSGIHGDNLEAIRAKFTQYGLKYPEGWSWDDAAASGAFRETPTGTGSVDPRTLRDLSTANGPAIVEGYQGTVAYITVRRPAGEVVEMTMGRTTSSYGTMTDAEISARGRSAVTGGSDAHGTLFFTSTGDDQVRVELRSAGALSINRNIGDPNAVKGTP